MELNTYGFKDEKYIEKYIVTGICDDIYTSPEFQNLRELLSRMEEKFNVPEVVIDRVLSWTRRNEGAQKRQAVTSEQKKVVDLTTTPTFINASPEVKAKMLIALLNAPESVASVKPEVKPVTHKEKQAQVTAKVRAHNERRAQMDAEAKRIMASVTTEPE